jgi:hypothetical protein
MHGEPLLPGAEVRRRAEGVRTDEHPVVFPPESDFAPAALVADRKELERPEPFVRDDVMRDAQSRGDRGAVTVMTVEELDHTLDVAEVGDAPIVDGIDEPRAAVGDERV